MPAEKGAELIAEDILREAKTKAAGIVRDAEKNARTMVHAANFSAKEEEDRELREARAMGKHLHEEILAEGRMAAKRQVLQKREELIGDFFKKVEDGFRKHTATERYKKDLPKAAAAAAVKIGQGKAVIMANRNDLKLLEASRDRIVRELGDGKNIEIAFGEPIKTIGGVKVRASNGKMEIDETFEAVMRREFEALRVGAAKVLFEGSK